MATYFHGSSSSEIQASGELQTLYLMNPNYLFYNSASSQNHHHNPPPPSPPTSNMIFLNSSHASPHKGVLLPEDPSQSHLSFNYIPIDQSTTQNSQPPQIPISSVGEDGFRRPLTNQQGLSLSLSSHQQGFYKSSSSLQMGGGPTNGEDSAQSVVFSSRYLKAVQELLDEVVNVGKGSDMKSDSGGGSKEKKKKKEIVREESDGGETSDAKRGAEHTTVQRQELQMKKAKLINMLDLVEQRYRQYHNQMQIVVASFEQAAGFGSAKSYTSLALKTISKQFRCLKDAISAQIKAMSKDLGEDLGGFGGGKGEGSSSRLRFIDQHLRQQRALQQLGMMQHNAWRPQRGLPERAVTVLRAWLFEHFLHPYPKDSDKHMLAKQTGLTRSQVSNWFINARVRLWKPMVEEMYLEEIKDQDQNGPSENASQNVESIKKMDGDNSTTKSQANEFEALQLSNREKPYRSQNASPTDDLSSSTISTSPIGRSFQVQDSFNLIGRTSEVGSVIHGNSPKKLRRTELQTINSPSSILQMDIHDMKLSQNNTKLEMPNRDHVYSLLSGGQDTDTGSGFGTSYQPIGEIGRFNSDQLGPRFHGNGIVSLTLGPPPIENNLSLSASHQNYFPNQNIHEFGRRLEMGNGGADFFASNNNSQLSHSSTSGFEDLSMQNKKRFVAQLLPDYVA